MNEVWIAIAVVLLIPVMALVAWFVLMNVFAVSGMFLVTLQLPIVLWRNRRDIDWRDLGRGAVIIASIIAIAIIFGVIV